MEEITKLTNPIDTFEFTATSRVPVYAETFDKKLGIISWGDDNEYPSYLLSLMNRSGKHNSILKGKAQMIGGNGIKKDGLSKAGKIFIKNEYDDDDLEEILAKISYDNEIFGCYALNIIWSKDRESISRISYIDVSKLRIAKVEDGAQQYYLLSPCWDYNYIRKNPPVRYPIFDPNDKTDFSQILMIQEYRPGNQFYSVPEYVSASKWVELEFEISQFHLKNVQNSFAPSMLLSFNNGVPTPEERESNKRNLTREYMGSINAGKVFIAYAESGQNAPTIAPIEGNANDSRFTQLNQDVEDGIFQGHRVTNPALFGVKTAGQLGNTSDMTDSLAIFQSMYVLPKQNSISKVLTYLGNINGIKDEFVCNPYEMKIPVKTTATDLINVLTAALPYDVKKQILIATGYNEEMADALILPLMNPTNITLPNAPTA